MEKIFTTLDDFDFNKLKISNPISKVGGYHLLKFTIDGSPLYIQPDKCMTKNGISTGKKSFTDLLFSNDNQEFLSWLENLESHCQQFIYDNRKDWFEGDLELDDIESYFISPIKFYKSGKFYLVRVNIPTLLGKPALKIYDESENEVHASSIDDKSDITTIIEFKGIKCSSRSFVIDIEVKQMMKMEPLQLFNKCIIKTNKINDSSSQKSTNINDKNNNISPVLNEAEVDVEILTENQLEDEVEDNVEKESENQVENEVENLTKNDSEYEVEKINNNDCDDNENDNNNYDNNNDIDNDIEKNSNCENTINDLGNSTELFVDTTDSIEEIKFDNDSILDSNEVVEIKEANEVYYKMYKEAIKRAKLARDLALTSYLEAKNIKNKYMLDEALCDSDDSDLEKELET